MSVDLESQSSGARSRSRCLDIFHTVSVFALTIMIFIAVTAALMYARHVEDQLKELREMKEEMKEKLYRGAADGSTKALIAPNAPANIKKTQNSAYLRATNSKLMKGVMEWESIEYGEEDSIGSLYSYNNKQSALTVNEDGSYFLYVQLKFSCTHICEKEDFIVHFYDQHKTQQLTCTVSLPSQPETSTEPVSKTCWRVVTRLEKGTRLLAKADLSKHTLETWKLELNDSGFGMFLVDRLRAA